MRSISYIVLESRIRRKVLQYHASPHVPYSCRGSDLQGCELREDRSGVSVAVSRIAVNNLCEKLVGLDFVAKFRLQDCVWQNDGYMPTKFTHLACPVRIVRAIAGLDCVGE